MSNEDIAKSMGDMTSSAKEYKESFYDIWNTQNRLTFFKAVQLG
jgi:hypothetical protein